MAPFPPFCKIDRKERERQEWDDESGDSSLLNHDG